MAIHGRGTDISTPEMHGNVDSGERRPYSRREVVIILTLVVAGALIVGNFNTTTQSVRTVSSGPLSISLEVVCAGFGEPTYYSTMDPEVNYTTYQYGHCLFGFWVSNGRPISPASVSAPNLQGLQADALAKAFL